MDKGREEYYQSHQKLSFISVNGQQQLKDAKVLVVGAGGLGCPCLQYLAGCGIGILGIADADKVSMSNIHRQVLYNINDVGKPKVNVAIEKLTSYNPYIQYKAHQIFADSKNVLQLLGEYDVIVDCTDNFAVRYLINDACVVLDKPLVYGAIHQTEGHVTVFNYEQSPTLRCLFPENTSNDSLQSCAEIGAYNIITGIIGLMMANEVIKIILKQPGVLAGKLNQYDALEGKMMQIKYQSSIDGRQISTERFEKPVASIEISAEELFKKINNKEDLLLIDVRRDDERQLFNIGGEHIPQEEFLQSSFSHLSHDTPIIVYCQHGIRSLRSTQYLRRKGFAKAFSLHGGMHHWQEVVSGQ